MSTAQAPSPMHDSDAPTLGTSPTMHDVGQPNGATMGEDDVNGIAINIASKQHVARENHVQNIISNLGMSSTTSGQAHHQMNPGPPTGNRYPQHQSALSQTNYPNPAHL